MTTSTDEHLDLVFGALADRTRRQLLAQLASAPASITELAAPHNMSLPGVSKHVRVLEHAGLIGAPSTAGSTGAPSIPQRCVPPMNGWLTTAPSGITPSTP